MVRESFTEKVIFEQRPKLSTGRNHVAEGGVVLNCRRVGVKSGEKSVLGKWRRPTGLNRSQSGKER